LEKRRYRKSGFIEMPYNTIETATTFNGAIFNRVSQFDHWFGSVQILVEVKTTLPSGIDSAHRQWPSNAFHFHLQESSP